MRKTALLCFYAFAASAALLLSACDSGGDTAQRARCENEEASNNGAYEDCEFPDRYVAPPGENPGENASYASLRALVGPGEGIEIVGAAVDASVLQGNQQYADTLAAQFNAATPENVMKWETIQPERGRFEFEAADRIMRFAQEHDMAVRGHTLVWHSQLPAWVENGDWTSAELLEIMKTHIDTVVNHFEEEFPGVITSWDVVNEAVSEVGGQLRQSIWLETIGEAYIDSAFTWTAEAASDDVALYYNDYGIAEGGPKENRVFQLASDLVSRGVPIDGVGFQSHYSISDDINARALRFRLEDYADLGLSTAITELDVGAGGEEPTNAQLDRQADLYDRFVRACNNASNCSELRIWGFTDAETWRPDVDPLIYDEDYERKPAFDAVARVLALAD